MHIKLTKLKSSKPIVPQLNDPIKTSKKDNLSNMFNLHIVFNILSVKIVFIYYMFQKYNNNKKLSLYSRKYSKIFIKIWKNYTKNNKIVHKYL